MHSTLSTGEAKWSQLPLHLLKAKGGRRERKREKEANSRNIIWREGHMLFTHKVRLFASPFDDTFCWWIKFLIWSKKKPFHNFIITWKAMSLAEPLSSEHLRRSTVEYGVESGHDLEPWSSERGCKSGQEGWCRGQSELEGEEAIGLETARLGGYRGHTTEWPRIAPEAQVKAKP